jgi:hypothetical protein
MWESADTNGAHAVGQTERGGGKALDTARDAAKTNRGDSVRGQYPDGKEPDPRFLRYPMREITGDSGETWARN